MQRRRWDSKDKLLIVLEGLKGEVPLGELCAKFQISQSQYYKWRDQLLANGPRIFDHVAVSTNPPNDSSMKTTSSNASLVS